MVTTDAVVTAIVVTAGTVAIHQGLEYVDGSLNKEEEDTEKEKKKKNVYAPNRPLPHKNGVRISDSDAPHTQLGTSEGSKGKYPQAREFGENGKPVKDIDFTDHGRPQKHTDPHQHKWEKNPTGGTPRRGDPEPLSGWNY